MENVVSTLSLPKDLEKKVREYAKKNGQTKSGFIRQALTRYIDRQEIADTQRELQAKARAMGIRTEDDVVKLIHDFRREQRRKKGH